MTALYCTFFNLSIKLELHYLQLNSMANAKSNIIYTRPYNIIKLQCPFVCVCVHVRLFVSGNHSSPKQVDTPHPRGDVRGLKIKKKSGKCHELLRKSITKN